MMNIIFRNDDVNANTSRDKLSEIYGSIHAIFPNSEIWSCITLFAGKNKRASVYEDLPLKNKETNWFYRNANVFMPEHRHPMYKIVSHGLYHVDHSKLDRGAQEMSILGSCAYLSSKIFVPPFNRFNQDTKDICFDNGILMPAEEKWKSLEWEKFDPSHKRWYFHSWRWKASDLKEILSGSLHSSKNS